MPDDTDPIRTHIDAARARHPRVTAEAVERLRMLLEGSMGERRLNARELAVVARTLLQEMDRSEPGSEAPR